MKQITVTFVVDDEDADLLEGAYPVLMVWNNGKQQSIHRAIAERMGLDGEVVDHKNRHSEINTPK